MGLVGLESCHTQTDGLTPGYITVDSLIPADTNGSRQLGFPGRAFPDVAFFVDGQDIGSYELGLDPQVSKIQVPYTGKHKLTIYGIVRADGQRSKRVNYPFYEGDTLTQVFLPGMRYPLGRRILQESRRLARPFPVEEHFEGTSAAVYKGPFGSVELQLKKDSINPDGTIWKKGGFGYLYAPAGRLQTITLAAKDLVLLPQDLLKPVYLEFDYRCNTPLLVGLYKEDNNGTADPGLNASPYEWKRAYIFMSDLAILVPNGSKVRFFIQANPDNLDSTKANYIAIDNIRLLHLKPRLY